MVQYLNRFFYHRMVQFKQNRMIRTEKKKSFRQKVFHHVSHLYYWLHFEIGFCTVKHLNNAKLWIKTIPSFTIHSKKKKKKNTIVLQV